MITTRIELTQEAQQCMAAISRVADWRRLARRIATVMGDQDELTVGYIQQEHLSQSGPRSLGQVSYRLRRTLRPRRPVIAGNAVISGFGTNVIYMRVHEFGFDGVENVKAHTRRFAKFEGRTISLRDAKSIRGKKMREKLQTGEQQVRAHTRHMVIPARAPLYHGTEERLPAIGRAASQAIVDEFNANTEGNA